MTVPGDTPVKLRAVAAPDQPDVTPALEGLYRGFEQELLVPLWTEIGDLMPAHPQSRAVPHLWRWDKLVGLADQAGHLVPVGRGGERRAIALANPALGGRPFATPTLWAAIQYLMPGEDAPEHRHTQHAFPFVVEDSGVWTVVGLDAVPMNRGDFLPQAGWNWHAHHNATDHPMAWIDGLDRWPGHPAPVRHRGTVLRVRPRRDLRGRADHAGALPPRAALGTSGPAPCRPSCGHRVATSGARPSARTGRRVARIAREPDRRTFRAAGVRGSCSAKWAKPLA